MSLLKIIDNPINDIALVTVLRSMIFGFNDNELIEIRAFNTNKSFYNSMCDYLERQDAKENLKLKVKKFFEKLDEFKREEEYYPLNEFIWKLYLDTGYYNYVSLMPNGILRASNLRLLFEKAKQYEKTSFKGLYNFISFIDKLRLSSKDMSGAKLISENENVVRIMSIHKSKGLEFPVVFLCGIAKKFNMQDINSDEILLHQDLGLGPKYINYEEGEVYNTVAREAIRQVSKKELISEEMRVLYVALTRAKEKLIITGMEKDYKKSISKKEELLSTYETIDKNNIINPNITQKYLSYLDWIELVSIKRKEELKEILEVKEYKKQDLLKELLEKEEIREIDLDEELEKVDEEEVKKLKEILEWKYEYNVSNNVMTKSSVTKIKNMKRDLKEEKIEYKIPEFLKETKRNYRSGKRNFNAFDFAKIRCNNRL